MVNTYKELFVWQKAIQLVKEVYLLSRELPHHENYNLVLQMRRSAVSISSNIAEGFGRRSRQDVIRFWRIAYGSSMELETQVIICKELKYCNNTKKVDELLLEVMKMLNTLTKY